LVAAVCVGAGILAAFLVLRPPAKGETVLADADERAAEVELIAA
jgi:hypothetical protein